MNKRVNTILFILGATAFNVIVAVISCIILGLLYYQFLRQFLPEGSVGWALNVIFLSGIAISIFVYRLVLRALLDKIDIEKYFDPIFVRKHKKPASSDPK